ncbi:uncharacterized protein LOC100833766 isoform X2 [Brachypodium distachyon]|nr:uncharacterized protein LOC100833766 isoform X2 [Brachypodium distachyon]XP_010229188.1 uncharacterized protein LOC100833766 isoform X2 [Brachypodium distachyon]KQK23592.1 hypothetical protein BRADI_1g74800v3 [Brachypodium distachyon]PNT78172.1 hypothetical protein BRADI_1g74800v3 [Brachypodium distachyon]PNT78173.1 hypothetical protein BRADI_1g74800v3 [Brachypodium distachyon]|eukprot:XP_010229187.1 uncharacterized protein LOC100833766 isoform X2 [Brachypodium distachyon]
MPPTWGPTGKITPAVSCPHFRRRAMDSEQQLPPPLKQMKQDPPVAPTTISSLGDDLLLEIFLRLPSLPSLVRAALTCRAALHAVRSSRVFRRRFRELHSPPLLGLLLDFFNPEMAAFVPVARLSDRDHAAALRAADIYLTRVLDDDPEWSIADCRDGYVVLLNWSAEQIAVHSPLTRAMHLFPIPPKQIYDELYAELHVLPSEEDPRSFRVVCVCHETWGAQAAVISSGTREWQISPWVDAASLQDGDADKDYSPHDGTLVNGCIYWTKASRANARVLNTTTMQFSLIDLPRHIHGQGALTPGETKDGELCIVCAVQRTLGLVVWLWRADDDGVERWMLDMTFPLSQKIDLLTDHSAEDHDALNILTIVDGFVYLYTYCEANPNSPGFFLSFCLETEKLTKLCPILHIDDLYPYIMGWPPCLVYPAS